MPSDATERLEGALRAIRENIILATHFVEGSSVDLIEKDVRTRYALIRALEIISEASRRLSPDVKARHSSIPWKSIADAGNVYRHDYESLSTQILWNTVQALPPLLTCVESELANLRTDNGS